ncbi:MAG: hypothetical protein DI629_21095 [Mesorhizobium amorphae]|nr:MAG: hypothetical protein DI629_21095 [Mesorhizobium amorphae]
MIYERILAAITVPSWREIPGERGSSWVVRYPGSPSDTVLSPDADGRYGIGAVTSGSAAEIMRILDHDYRVSVMRTYFPDQLPDDGAGPGREVAEDRSAAREPLREGG